MSNLKILTCKWPQLYLTNKHLFNLSSPVFNNRLQSTLESFAWDTQLFWEMKFYSRRKFAVQS